MAERNGGQEQHTAYSRILAFENAMCMRLNQNRMERYRRNWEYYAGENLPPDNVEQPLGVNLIGAINNKHAHYLFGEYQDDLVGWRVDPEGDGDGAKDLANRIARYGYRTLRATEGNPILYGAALNASIYGDAFLRLRWDPLEGQVFWESICPEYVHCAWPSTNLDQTTEVLISYPVSRSQAQHEWGTAGNPSWARGQRLMEAHNMAVYWEYWTPLLYQIWIDDVCVQNLPNPYITYSPTGLLVPGVIPIVHLPNIRASGEFYGFADCEGSQLLQDELNRKLADEGDVISNFAHPITVVNKYYQDVEELPVGPDQIWDLGREGEAKILSWEGPSPQTHEYVEILRELILETSSMSQIAFGRHKGSQQSAIALAVEMLPVTERVKWKRMIWNSALRKLVRTSALIETRMGKEIGFTYEQLLQHYVRPQWAPILPRDRLALVNENVALVVNHLRTIQRALEDLGEENTADQEKAILEQLKKLAELGIKLQGSAATGSSSLPEGVSENSAKGRPQGSTKS